MSTFLNTEQEALALELASLLIARGQTVAVAESGLLEGGLAGGAPDVLQEGVGDFLADRVGPGGGLQDEEAVPILHALVFELAGMLWFYTAEDGTQSFSLRIDRLDAEKADFGPMLRDIARHLRHRECVYREWGFGERHALGRIRCARCSIPAE